MNRMICFIKNYAWTVGLLLDKQRCHPATNEKQEPSSRGLGDVGLQEQFHESKFKDSVDRCLAWGILL